VVLLVLSVVVVAAQLPGRQQSRQWMVLVVVLFLFLFASLSLSISWRNDNNEAWI